MPESWRNRDPSSMIMSFDMPVLDDGSTIIFFQANSQLPAFGRYVLECSEQERIHRVLDNPMGVENLWAPQTASPWNVCLRDGEYKFETAEKHGECALCKGAKATELVPCCWCTNWIHLRCSYAVPSGRACASHFEVQNPLEKQVVACKDDPLVPEDFRERPVFPNIVIPRYQPTRQDGAKAAMNNMELVWIYRHAWRGAGLYYRKGDHVVTQESQEDKPSSMFKAMTMYPVWDKWIMPRCDAIPQRYQEEPQRWSLSSIDDARAPLEIPPLGRVRWEYLLLDQLSHDQGNLFRIWYEDLHDYEKSFWHAFMQKASQKQEFRWEDLAKEEPLPVQYEPVKDFDPRFFYYDHYTIITEAKCVQWAIEEEQLEPGLALDPASYLAKAMQRKRKEPPTEADLLSSVRKRPTTPPQEGGSAGSPTSAGATAQASVSLETLTEAVGTPTAMATGASPAFHSQETTSGHSQPMDVSQQTEQSQHEAESQPADQLTSQEAESQPDDRQTSQPPESAGTVQQVPTKQTAEVTTEGSEAQRLRQERIDKLTRIMLESIHRRDIGISPAAEATHQVVVTFAQYASQFDHLSKAQRMVQDYSRKVYAELL